MEENYKEYFIDIYKSEQEEEFEDELSVESSEDRHSVKLE